MPGPLIVLESLCIFEGADPLSLLMEKGESWAVMGPAASGKSQFIDILMGEESPASGSAVMACDFDFADMDPRNRRISPQRIAQNASGRDEKRALEAIKAVRLREDQDQPAANLSPSQTIACAMLECLAGTSPVGLIDGHLDALDPWAREEALKLMEQQAREEGRCFVAVTGMVDVAERMGNVLVLQQGSAAFAGPVRELAERGRPTEYEIETDDRSTIRNMAEPFAMTIRDTEHGLIFQAKPGQERAVRLMLEGYGTITALAIREPRLEEALRQLL